MTSQTPPPARRERKPIAQRKRARNLRRKKRFTVSQEKQIGREIMKVVCSDYWYLTCSMAVDSGEVSVTEIVEPPNRRGEVHRYLSPVADLEDRGIFPPSDLGRPSQMKRCSYCEQGVRWYPRYFVSDGRTPICWDCYIAWETARRAKAAAAEGRTEGTANTESPTRLALDELEHRRLTMAEAKLEPEDEASLAAEIQGYLAAAGGKTGAMVVNLG